MAESVSIPDTSDKEVIYSSILPQLRALLEGETNRIARLSNTAAVLKTAFQWLWVGFYLVEDDELVLGPFQGPVACTRIRKGKGVCGTAWDQQKTIIVPDVEKFPGHIACSSESRSEIVVPLIKDGLVWGVLDADSEHYGHFTPADGIYLEQLALIL